MKPSNIFIKALIVFAPIAAKSQIVDYNYNNGAKFYLQAEKNYEIGLLENAERDIVKAINKYPNATTEEKNDLLLSKIDYASGNYQNADTRLDIFIKKHYNSPLIPYAWSLRACNSFANGDYELAESYYEKSYGSAIDAVKIRQDSLYLDLAGETKFWKGISQANQGKRFDAMQSLQSVITINPASALADDALYYYSLYAEQDRKYDTAASALRNIRENYQYRDYAIAAKIREANLKLTLNEPSAALLLLESASGALERYEKKDSLGSLYEPQKSINSAKEVIACLYGEAYNKQRLYSQAQAIFENFLKTYPKSVYSCKAKLGAAWAALNLQDHNAAIAYYTDVIDNYPENERDVEVALMYRAIAIKRGGDNEKAHKEFASLSIKPNFPFASQALLELGQMQYEGGDYENAKKSLERADRESNDAVLSVRIHSLLGETYLELGNYAKSVREFQLVESIAKNSSTIFLPNKDEYLNESRLKQGIALSLNLRNSEAIKPLSAYLAESSPNDARREEALFWLAECFYRSALYKNAEANLISFIETYPRAERKEEALYSLGWTQFKMRNFSAAANSFNKLTQEYPKSEFLPEVYTRQGDAYYVEKRFRNAAEAYQKAFQLAPKSDEGRYSAVQEAQSYYKAGASSEALTALANYLRVYPKDAFSDYAVYLTGWIKFQAKNYDEAITNFKYLINEYPKSDERPRAYYAIGDAYYNKGEFDNALSAYKQTMELFPSTYFATEAMKGVQYCLMALGKSDEAVSVIDDFIKKNPNSPIAPEFAINKANIFQFGGKFADASQEYQNFLKSFPESDRAAEAMYFLGKSYSSLNDAENALKEYQAIKKKYPNSDYAPLALLETGFLYRSTANFDDASAAFQDLESSYPTAGVAEQACFERAMIQLSKGDTLKCISQLKLCGDKYGLSEYGVQAYYKVAMYYRSISDVDSARTYFKKLSSDTSNPAISAEAAYRIGELSLRDKNFRDALNQFLMIKEKFSGVEDWYTRALLDAGYCYQVFEKWQEAADLYNAIVLLRPDDDFGATAKSRLQSITPKLEGKK